MDILQQKIPQQLERLQQTLQQIDTVILEKVSKIEFVNNFTNPNKTIWATVKSVTANGDPNR